MQGIYILCSSQLLARGSLAWLGILPVQAEGCSRDNGDSSADLVFCGPKNTNHCCGPDGKECDLWNHLDGWVGDEGVYAVWTSMYMKPVPLVVSNTTWCWFSKWQHAGKGDKEKEDEQTSSVILECGKRHNTLMLIPTNSFTHPALVIDNAGCSSNHNKSLIDVKPRSLWLSDFI